MTLVEWLASLGLSEYAGRFAENRIDLAVLRDLTDQDLKDLGVVLGDRRKCSVRSRSLPKLPRPRRHPGRPPSHGHLMPPSAASSR